MRKGKRHVNLRIFKLVIDLSNFDSEIPITAALLDLAIYLSSSILGSRLLIFNYIGCKLFVQKYPFHRF